MKEISGAPSFATDIEETESDYRVTVELPGVAQRDISIECGSGHLTVRAERHAEPGRPARFYGSYQRTFSLPYDVDADSFHYSYFAGVLKIVVPKEEKKGCTDETA